MAVPTIRSGPQTSVTYNVNNSIPGGSGKTLNAQYEATYPNSNFVIFSQGFNSAMVQITNASAGVVGANLSRTMGNDAIKGPDHVSIFGNCVYPITAAAGSMSIYAGNTNQGGYWHFFNRDTYNGGWRQMIADPTALPSSSLNGGAGTALPAGGSVTEIKAYFDSSNGNQDMFEAFGCSIAWCGRDIVIDGGTSLDPIDFQGVSDADRAQTRTTAAPLRGNFFGHVISKGSIVTLNGPVTFGSTTANAYFVAKGVTCQFEDIPVNVKFFRFDIQYGTIIFGEPNTTLAPDPVVISGSASRRWALDSATVTPTEFSIYSGQLKFGRSWFLGSTTKFVECTVSDVDSITINALTNLNGSTFSQAYIHAAFLPSTLYFKDVVIRDVQSGSYGLTITGTYAGDTLTLDGVQFTHNFAGSDINFAHSGTINLVLANGAATPDYTITGGGTVNFIQGNTKTITGLPSGAEARVLRGAYTMPAGYEDNIVDGDFVFSYTPDDRPVTIRMTLAGYIIEPIEIVLDNIDQSIPATVKPDPSYI